MRARISVSATLNKVIAEMEPAFGQYCTTWSPANIDATTITAHHCPIAR